ncbi:putative deacylase [Hyella patelloides LEGE 07179]|uniref:Putative deacylase n=1 Tax=Hyella patelloides LEGE 07179 TaxID=945734 RepID=A0A563VQ59_9CYAN|nr:succinylglutamate desuccinylase/aspartoacylase family protein [Hyella patelloides]VEP13563.1 putative deacylase [Hyella patelloides LEGE 07179]
MLPKIETINLLKLASGDILSLQVYKFIGKQPGKKVYIQSNLHGGEIVGNAVIQQLIEYLSTVEENALKGEIWLVPACNPLGTNQRGHFFATGRFNSYDGKNWNRIFWDYEKECDDLTEFARSHFQQSREIIRKNYLEKIQSAWQKELAKLKNPSSGTVSNQYRAVLQSLCLDADYVIDIHSSSNQAIDFLFCFKTREKSANYFLIDYGILMTEYDGDAFDEAFLKPWLALEKEFKNLGHDINFDLESWTLELGSGMTMNPDSVTKGVRGIKNYLLQKKVLQLDEIITNHKIKLVQRSAIKSYYAATGGMVQNRLPLCTEVKKGDLIYQLLSFNKQQQLPEIINVVAETDGIIFDLATNQSVNQGEYVLDILVID